MADPYAIRRDQLARFIPDNETILRFQRLFQVAGELTPGDVTDLETRMDAAELAIEENEFYIMTRGLD